MTILVASGAVLVVGCASTANYESILHAWVDRSADELVREWGYPDDQLTAPNGNLVYVYRKREIYSAPGLYRGLWYGGRSYSIYDPTEIAQFECTTFLEVDKLNRIVRWEWRGNSCVAAKASSPSHQGERSTESKDSR